MLRIPLTDITKIRNIGKLDISIWKIFKPSYKPVKGSNIYS